jgi:ferrochelatase
VNLGTPDEPRPAAVRRYLREFLSDPRVVEIPRACGCRSSTCCAALPPAKTAKKYASIWMNDGSPLRVYTSRQAQLLRGYLGERSRSQAPVAYRDALRQPSDRRRPGRAGREGLRPVVVIPLYPQYAGSTTRSVARR